MVPGVSVCLKQDSRPDRNRMIIITVKAITKVIGNIYCHTLYIPCKLQRHYYFLHYAGEKEEKRKKKKMSACDKQKQ